MNPYENPYNTEEDFVAPESDELTSEQKEDSVIQAKLIKTIKVYKPDNTLDREKTIAERKKFITDRALENTERYTKLFKIGEDADGLPDIEYL